MPGIRKIRAIIDTNLFISFLIGKKLQGLKDLLINSRIELIFAEQNIQELRLVSQRPKFKKYFRSETGHEKMTGIFAGCSYPSALYRVSFQGKPNDFRKSN
jgi:putative PIN family toxin of toxin-antitoxin system